MTEHSIAELVRRIEDLTTTQKEMLREMREDRALMAQTYVRQDVYEAESRSARTAAERASAENAQDILDVKRDRERDADWKKQITAMLVTALIGVLGSGAIAVFNLLTGG